MVAEVRQDKIMMITRDRVFYRGLLGRGMKPRRLGACVIYAALDGELCLRRKAGHWQEGQIVAVPAYEPHEIVSSHRIIASMSIEPERVDPRALSTLETRVNSAEGADLLKRFQQAPDALCRAGCDVADFDRLVLGQPLASRILDPRIEMVLGLFETEGDPEDGPLTADDCAALSGLSTSRFLHLFKDETGVSFRNLRMWKRARRFLQHACTDNSLTEVALDLGYPDSSHFSHSIRKIYGLKPRYIREGSRGLTVIASTGRSEGIAAE